MTTAIREKMAQAKDYESSEQEVTSESEGANPITQELVDSISTLVNEVGQDLKNNSLQKETSFSASVKLSAIYNLANDQNTTLEDFADTICNTFKKIKTSKLAKNILVDVQMYDDFDAYVRLAKLKIFLQNHQNIDANKLRKEKRVKDVARTLHLLNLSDTDDKRFFVKSMTNLGISFIENDLIYLDDDSLEGSN